MRIKKEVVIYKPAFDIMALSLIEVYKKEGMLEGFGRRELISPLVRYHVQLACPYQKAERKYIRVTIPSKFVYFYDIPDSLDLTSICDIHDHTPYRINKSKKRKKKKIINPNTLPTTEPSDEDKEWLKENPDQFSIIWSIYETNSKRRGWLYTPDKKCIEGITEKVIGVRKKTIIPLKLRCRASQYNKKLGKSIYLDMVPAKDLQEFISKRPLK